MENFMDSNVKEQCFGRNISKTSINNTIEIDNDHDSIYLATLTCTCSSTADSLELEICSNYNYNYDDNDNDNGNDLLAFQLKQLEEFEIETNSKLLLDWSNFFEMSKKQQKQQKQQKQKKFANSSSKRNLKPINSKTTQFIIKQSINILDIDEINECKDPNYDNLMSVVLKTHTDTYVNEYQDLIPLKLTID